MRGVVPGGLEGPQIIQNYGNGSFSIAGKLHSGSVIVFPTMTISWEAKDYQDITDLSIRSIPSDEANIEILLVGCGMRMGIPRDDVRDYLRGFGIVTEWMDTGAACRTFNVLLSEDRAVAAALIAIV